MITRTQLARASSVKTGWLRYALILLIAATVILSTKVVGVLLVTAMLILPGAAGTLSGRAMPTIALVSMAAAMSSTTAGMVVSNFADVPPGAVIVLFAFAIFLAAFYLRRRRDLQTSATEFKPRILL